jgi:hypothetical protein
MSFGHCERYGWFKGFMDDVSKTNVVLKNSVSVTILSIYIYILHEISGQIHLIKNVFPVLSLVTHVVYKVYIYHTVVNPLICSSYKNVKWDDYLIVINNYDNVIRNHKQNKQSTFVVIFNIINYWSNEICFFFKFIYDTCIRLMDGK